MQFNSFLLVLLRSYQSKYIMTNKSNQIITYSILIANMIKPKIWKWLIWILGHDTTASAISWILYSLAKHPEYQKKCQEKIDDLLDGRESDDIKWYALFLYIASRFSSVLLVYFLYSKFCLYNGKWNWWTIKYFLLLFINIRSTNYRILVVNVIKRFYYHEFSVFQFFL